MKLVHFTLHIYSHLRKSKWTKYNIILRKIIFVGLFVCIFNGCAIINNVSNGIREMNNVADESVSDLESDANNIEE